MAAKVEGQTEAPETTAALLRTIALLNAEVDKSRAATVAASPSATAPQAPGTKPWITSVVQFLGIPTAVAAMVISITQVTGNFQSSDKTVAETQKIKSETNLNEVQLQRALADLEASKTKTYEEARAELNRTLPVIIESTMRLQELNAQTTRTGLDVNIARFVLLWILFQGVSLVFGIIYQLWSPFIGGVSMGFDNWLDGRRRRAWESNPRQDTKKLDRLRYLAQWVKLVVWPLPSILQWALQLSIFAALMIPLFNEIAVATGSTASFETIWSHAKHFEFSKAMLETKSVLKLH